MFPNYFFRLTLSRYETDAVKYVILTHIIHIKFLQLSVYQPTWPSQSQILPWQSTNYRSIRVFLSPYQPFPSLTCCPGKCVTFIHITLAFTIRSNYGAMPG